MKRMVWSSCAALVVSATVATAQESVQTVKELYASAAYEDALAAVSRLQGDRPRREVEHYRVFSLTALGRLDEAEKAMEALVRADPSYALDPAETPPRVQEAFAKVRQRLLPVVTTQLYLDARAALDRKERAEAIEQFERLLKIIDGAGASAGSFGELRVLADGFLDLSRALPVEAAEAAGEVDTAASATPAALPPAPAPPASGTPASPAAAVASSGDESRPFALAQELPPWAPNDALSRRASFSGAVTVRIGTDGRVASAELTQPVHPNYDQVLLRAARNWRYQPAMRDGKPVEAELTVEVHLQPPQ